MPVVQEGGSPSFSSTRATVIEQPSNTLFRMSMEQMMTSPTLGSSWSVTLKPPRLISTGSRRTSECEGASIRTTKAEFGSRDELRFFDPGVHEKPPIKSLDGLQSYQITARNAPFILSNFFSP